MPKKSVFNKTRRLRGGGETEDKLTGIEAKLTGIEAKLTGIEAKLTKMFSGEVYTEKYGRGPKNVQNLLQAIAHEVTYKN
jgi:hypothetical protein